MYKSVIISLFCIFSLAHDGPVFVDKLENAFIESKESEKDLLIVFSADWCGNCVIFKKYIMEDSSILSNMVVCFVDFDSNDSIVKEYKVKKIPDFRYYKDSAEIGKKIGYSNRQEFDKWIAGHKDQNAR